MTDTKALELIFENGSVNGVLCSDEDRNIVINAASTILCTGGYANDPELTRKYIPNIDTEGTFLGDVHQGDGLIMAEQVGAKIIANGCAITNPMDLGKTNFQDAQGIMLNITPKGERYSNENEYWFKRSSNLYFKEGFDN